MRRPLIAAAALALAVPLLAACGSSGGTQAGSSPSASATCVAKADVTAPKANTTVGKAPAIEKPTGQPPCELIVKDLKVGKGAAVTDTAAPYDWSYEGVSWSTGQKFDSSFDRGAPISFALNQVIPGWTEGLQGMKPGGRRMLIIPGDKAYGAAGSPPNIGPNETLVFVVDLVGPSQG